MAGALTKEKRGVIDWNVVDALYLEGLQPLEIARRTGAKLGSIQVGLTKRGLTVKRRELQAKGQNGQICDVDALSRVTRSKIAVQADRLVDALADETPRGAEEINLQADTLQKVTKTASLVHGWGESSTVSVIMAGVLSGSDDTQAEQPAIDVQSERIDDQNEG